MTRSPARIPPFSRGPTWARGWYATAGGTGLAAIALLSWHTNRLITAAGVLAAGAAGTALAEAYLRSRRSRPTDFAATAAATLILAMSLLVLLGIISYVTR